MYFSLFSFPPGILDAADAKLAVESGADAIVVSNHGGRQLDGALSSIKVLPSIVEAVGDKVCNFFVVIFMFVFSVKFFMSFFYAIFLAKLFRLKFTSMEA